jgi:hypothetical protein
MKNWCGIKCKLKSFVSPKQWLFDYLASASVDGDSGSKFRSGAVL